MNLDLPLPVGKRNLSFNTKFNPFPVTDVSTDGAFSEKCFTGIFTGLSVEIFDQSAIRELYVNGSYGMSIQTKTTPKLLSRFPRMDCVTQSQYERKLEWSAKYQNQNPDDVKILMKTIDEIEHTEECGEECPHVIPDPFPIEEVLALSPEETLFLHHTLRCLKVFDFEQTKEYSTDEMIDIFCNMNEKFIERYVAYHFYRSKNWIVRSGIKFGGDFREFFKNYFNVLLIFIVMCYVFIPVLYYKGPHYHHATYVVIVNDNEVDGNFQDIQSNYRVAETTGKEVIILKVTRPNGLQYSDRHECIHRLNEFKVTEVIPKRFQVGQLNQSR